MRVTEIITPCDIGHTGIIKQMCSQFIDAADGLPVYKHLPHTYEDFQKVKVRKRKHTNTFSSTFNGAFKDTIRDLRERSIFANGMNVDNFVDESLESFYIFPIDGYKFLYSKEVKDSTDSYKRVFESIFDQLGVESGEAVFKELLQFSYISEDLPTGIRSGAELILYGVPYYYAIRETSVDNYEKLLTMLV